MDPISIKEVAVDKSENTNNKKGRLITIASIIEIRQNKRNALTEKIAFIIRIKNF